jgi:hypothetical protein
VISDFLSREGESTRSPQAPLDPVENLAETFRHGGWMPTRRRVEQALRDTPGISHRRHDAFCKCGCDARVEWAYPATFNGYANPHTTVREYRIISTKCRDRFCVPCAGERSGRIRAALLQHMADKKNLSLITLTLKASSDPLGKILDRITRHFRNLRSKALWKKNISGGVAIIETKLGSGSGAWHVHFHVIAEAKYVHKDALSQLWEKITGDSRIVDVKRVGALTGAVKYITKYVTKAADQSIINSPRHLSEALTGFAARRLVTTFGSWRGLQLNEGTDDDPQEPSPDTWYPLGPLHDILIAAKAGDDGARSLVRMLKRGRAKPPPQV